MSQRGIKSPQDRLPTTLRNLTSRVTKLERRPDGRANASHELPVKFGPWTLDVDADTGDLIATNEDTGNTTIIASA